MLLPSAFSCDGAAPQGSRPQRPRLQSFGAYQPKPQPRQLLHPHSQYTQQARPSPLSSSCRALQAILGTPSGSTTPQSSSAAPQNSARRLSDPFALAEPTQPVTVAPRQVQPHRSANKRRRSEFERDLIPSDPSDVQMDECPSPQPLRTPKRRRRIPLAMPLGLCADDFRALETPDEAKEEEPELGMPSMSPHHAPSDRDSAYGSSPSTEECEWTIEDDRMLVETVLEKFKLSKRDWNDCARILGKDRDTLGRRWSLLVGEGNVGLRRGGRISRTSLDISSW